MDESMAELALIWLNVQVEILQVIARIYWPLALGGWIIALAGQAWFLRFQTKRF